MKDTGPRGLRLVSSLSSIIRPVRRMPPPSQSNKGVFNEAKHMVGPQRTSADRPGRGTSKGPSLGSWGCSDKEDTLGGADARPLLTLCRFWPLGEPEQGGAGSLRGLGGRAPWLVDICLSVHMTLSPCCLCPSFRFYKETSHTGYAPTLMTSFSSISVKILSLNKVTFGGH